MIWSRLKNMCCPKDNSPLNDIGEYYACTKRGCIFSMNKKKFESVVADLYAKKPSASYRPPTELENLSAMNNLGHDVQSRDYGGTDFYGQAE